MLAAAIIFDGLLAIAKIRRRPIRAKRSGLIALISGPLAVALIFNVGYPAYTNLKHSQQTRQAAIDSGVAVFEPTHLPAGMELHLSGVSIRHSQTTPAQIYFAYQTDTQNATIFEQTTTAADSFKDGHCTIPHISLRHDSTGTGYFSGSCVKDVTTAGRTYYISKWSVGKNPVPLVIAVINQTLIVMINFHTAKSNIEPILDGLKAVSVQDISFKTKTDIAY